MLGCLCATERNGAAAQCANGKWPRTNDERGEMDGVVACERSFVEHSRDQSRSPRRYSPSFLQTCNVRNAALERIRGRLRDGLLVGLHETVRGTYTYVLLFGLPVLDSTPLTPPLVPPR